MAAGERETLGTYPNQCFWSKRVECLKDAGHQWYERFEAVAIGNQHDDGDGQRFEVKALADYAREYWDRNRQEQLARERDDRGWSRS